LLNIDHEAAIIWGEVTARARKQGVTIPAVDGLLAATALRHGLHFMTRNTKHVAATGVLLINPWESSKK
jgi:toxin FitB